MSGNPTFEVIKRYVTWLRGHMPNQPQPSEMQPRPVGVYYSHPGDVHADMALVWVENIRWQQHIHSLRAEVRRRVVDVEFDLMVGVSLEGPTDDDELQFEADSLVASIVAVVDLDIASEEHLHSPDLIDMASIAETTMERGKTATGAGARATMTVEFQARYID